MSPYGRPGFRRTTPDAGTHQDVHVTGSRIVSTVADGLLLGALYAVMAALFGTYERIDTFGWDASMRALPTAGYALLVLLYCVLMEAYLGQTLGKMLAGIGGLGEGTGNRASGLRASVIRTALRAVDGPLGYAVALLTVLVSGKNQRFGDMAAGILVVCR